MTEREHFGDFEVREARRVIYQEAEMPSAASLEEVFSDEGEPFEMHVIDKDHLIVVFDEEVGPQEIQANRVVPLADDKRLRQIFLEDSVEEIKSRGVPVNRYGAPLRARRLEDGLTDEQALHLRVRFKLGDDIPDIEPDPEIVEAGLQKLRHPSRMGFSPDSYIIRAENGESFLVEPKKEKV